MNESTDRADLESASKQAGFRLRASEHDNWAIIEGPKHGTVEELLSDEPLVFGRYIEKNKQLGYYSTSFTERDGREVAVVRDTQGQIVAEHPAQVRVPRLSNVPAPEVVFGGPGCFLEVKRTVGDCYWAHFMCRNVDVAWGTCG